MPPRKTTAQDLTSRQLEVVESKIDVLSDKVDAHGAAYGRLDERLTSHIVHNEKTDDRLEHQLNVVNEHLFGIKEILGRQQSSIDEHIRRTNLLEEKIEGETSKIKSELKPILDQNQQFQGLWKFSKVALRMGGLLEAISAGGFGIKELVGFIFK